MPVLYTISHAGVQTNIMVLKYYYDLMSQPCRALYIFLKLNKIPFESKTVALRKDEHRTEEYTKLNPFQRVPVVDDDGFVLTESCAIMKYLAVKHNVPDHWYPRQDLQAQARVDQYLHWQHLATRMQPAMLFRHLLIIPRMTNEPVDWKEVKKFKASAGTSIKFLETYFLKDHPYLCGNDISIADILGICELMQLHAVLEENMYESSPVINAWEKLVKERLNPTFDDAHKIVYGVRDMYKKMQQSSKM